MNSKCSHLAASLLLAVGLTVAAGGPVSATPGGPPPPCTLDAPTIQCIGATATSITLRVCAGASGAPAGISIHWKLLSEWQSDAWAKTGSYDCISLNGTCNQGTSGWNLPPGQCQDITINANVVNQENAENGCGASSECTPNDLLCDKEYIFRAFAHNDPGPGGCNTSDFSANVICRTATCPEGDCTLTWGYWKTHGPAGCNPPGHENLWPVDNLTIGCLNLDENALCSILQDAPKACGKGVGANAVLLLEHQLIAAMLNRASGAIVCNFADQAITAANGLLCGQENACVGVSTVLGQQMIAVQEVLGAYNSDQCSCPVSNKPMAAPVGAKGKTGAADVTPTTKTTTWGNLKVIYR